MKSSSPIIPGDHASGAAYNAHLDFSMFIEEARKHEQCKNVGVEAAKKSWKKYFSLLSKFQHKMKHKATDSKAPNGSQCRNAKRGPFLSGPIFGDCGKLARIHRTIRRSAAVCFTPSSADEGDLPYMQLDQVTHALKREAFGPIYLVT